MDEEFASTTRTEQELVCIECLLASTVDARGWRAYVLDGELLVYCPACASREFDADA